jgi:hypothetical protein
MTYSKELVLLDDAPREGRRAALAHLLAPLVLVGLVAALASLTTAPAQRPAAGVQAAVAAPAGAPAIEVAAVMVAEPLKETPLAIQLVPADLVPPGGWLRIGGLPELASLSDGHATGPGAWRVPVAAVSTLKVIAPAGAKAEIAIALTSADGVVLTEARSTLLAAAASHVGAGAPRRTADARPGANGDLAAQVLSMLEARRRAQNLVRKGDENMAEGNVAAARAFYERAARMGWSQAAIALAATFDPNEARYRWGTPGLPADPAAAQAWYAKARELAQAEAAEIDDYLTRLGSRAP